MTSGSSFLSQEFLSKEMLSDTPAELVLWFCFETYWDDVGVVVFDDPCELETSGVIQNWKGMQKARG